MVVGSTGQPRPNGLYDLVFKIEASIREDEKQLGIGRANRLRLGVALSRAPSRWPKSIRRPHAADPRTALTVVAD